MKLVILGIDSTEFDRKRWERLQEQLIVIENWMDSSKALASERKSICEVAAILDKLVTRDPPLTQYRGLTFAKLDVADALLDGKMSSKYPCESWSEDDRVSAAFIDTYNQGKTAVGYVMKKNLSRNEIILNVYGLAMAMKALARNWQVAIERREVHPEMRRGRASRHVEELFDFVRRATTYNELEFLVHPRPYSPKDIFKMKIGEGSSSRINARTPNLLRIVNSHPKYSPEDLEEKWLHLKEGKIARVVT